MVKGVWLDFLVILVLNKFIYKLIILESYRFLFIYISKIGFYLKLEIFKVNEIKIDIN